MANPFALEPQPNGKATLNTSFGDVVVELWGRETPLATRNFVQLALEGFYDGCIFHRVIPNFIAQTGDPTGTGSGGESIYDEPFADEINQRIKFNRRGLVAMANESKKNTNSSQFFITLDKTEALQRKHTIFGRIEGDTLFNVLKLNDIGEFCDPPDDEKPLYPPVIRKITVDENPFPDIVPRITAEERKEQEKARKQAKKEAKETKRASGRKATKNKALLSFGDDEEGDQDSAFKFRAANDLAEEPAVEQKPAKRPRTEKSVNEPTAAEEISGDLDTEMIARVKKGHEERRSKAEPSLEGAVKGEQEEKPQKDVRAEIEKVQSSLKRMAGQREEDEEAQKTDSKQKGKDRKYDGASLLAAERKQYSKGKTSIKDTGLADLVSGFRGRLSQAMKEGEGVEGEGKGYNEEDDEGEGDEGSDDEGWLTHSLVFRKDAALDQAALQDYVVHDPLDRPDRNKLTLDEVRRDTNRRDRERWGEKRDQPRDRDRRHAKDRRDDWDNGRNREDRRYRDR